MSSNNVTIGRRGLLAGAAAVTAGTLVGPQPASASGSQSNSTELPKGPAPKPIPGGVDSGDPNVGFIHWWLPGPTDATTPIIGLAGFGLDVDPSTITDFDGDVAMAVVAGSVVGSDGETYACEFDVRAMKGDFIAETGKKRHGAFAFL